MYFLPRWSDDFQVRPCSSFDSNAGAASPTLSSTFFSGSPARAKLAAGMRIDANRVRMTGRMGLLSKGRGTDCGTLQQTASARGRIEIDWVEWTGAVNPALLRWSTGLFVAVSWEHHGMSGSG